MGGYLVVEGETDGKLLGRLIPEDIRDKITIAVSHGKSAAVSLCGSILSKRQAPTALVVDADTTDEEQIREQYLIFDDLIRPAAGAAPYRVKLAVPQIETIFFSDPGALERLTGAQLIDADIITAKYEPKEVIARLMQRAGISDELELIARLSEQALDSFGQHELVVEITKFFRESLLGTGFQHTRGQSQYELGR